MLDEQQCWKVSGVMAADDFFRAVAHLLPDATHMFLEGQPHPDLVALLGDAVDEADYGAPIGTIWSSGGASQRFSVRTTPELFWQLSEAASKHAEPEICCHVHFYRGQQALLEWFDAFSDPLFVSKSVAREKMELFALAVGGVLSDGDA